MPSRQSAARELYDASARNSKIMLKTVGVVVPLEASRG